MCRIDKMEIIETKLDGIKLIKTDVFEDLRGTFTRSFSEKEYRALGQKFVEDGFSISSKNVLRGIHGDSETFRIYSCPFGEVYNVVVNCDPQSKKFGEWEGFDLSRENGMQVFVPPMFGNAYFVLSDEAVVHYKRSEYYAGPGNQFTYRFNDPKFKIDWPMDNPILSKRDSDVKIL